MVTLAAQVGSKRPVMWWVLGALVPGAAGMAALLGPGVLFNCGIAAVTAWATEALCLKARGSNLEALRDGSVLVTALIVALCCPPGASPWVVAFAVATAVALGKHAFGGLGQNPFNPAMVGYCIALLSFPSDFALWPLGQDGVTGATALDSFKHRGGLTVEESDGQSVWPTINALFAVGGLALVAARIAAWRVIASFLVVMAMAAVVFYDGGSSESLGSPLFHLSHGGTLLAAFFVLTDPVSHPNGRRAQWLFGAVVALVTFTIRAVAAYPDGIAFAVLFGNACTPYLERRWPT